MNFKDYKEELMKDPEFAKAYRELQPEVEAEVAAIKAALAAPAPQDTLQKAN
jgi:hypothetical protein